MPNFVSQFGISPDADMQRGLHDVGPILDNPMVASNDRGTVLFTTLGPDTMTKQIFVNMNNYWYLDGKREEQWQ